MGLFFRILPDKILTFKGENCSGGRAKNPRCFKNVRTLPCACHANSNPWMTMRMLEWNEGFWDTFYECWMTKCGFRRMLSDCFMVANTDESVANSRERQQIPATPETVLISWTRNNVVNNPASGNLHWTFYKNTWKTKIPDGFRRMLSDCFMVANTDESVTNSRERQQIPATPETVLISWTRNNVVNNPASGNLHW
ncbi:hypothetical protein T10_294 [Trichinella papuae]|uniref:Uncharacterized protein n=1 Tax=Trichinella papuae TaxID=268474 RepID=A0A0V1M6K8_9BILA|nr:hypothetical protein T10_294 [Trichinella papuae]